MCEVETAETGQFAAEQVLGQGGELVVAGVQRGQV